ncbi:MULTISPECIES: NtaA/DmoA family FMN-dependent monooxygenase [unclassified Actinomyces]|uniref:NtaA/DmoA family FMN-dependent monooxygenase n=1 Tax=unclassified Actinomyces TaxID=2609248 RepID=UPI0013A6F513|nr:MULTISPECIES: NtaA/DmoA family FMN-dependent monooxygenase [unclassified Actinomyces]MBW3069998.1 NtaA/DmoA family FMN-dependent monooxygenase [Actinomyces sp. 594]NDR52988.1 NtaA/DmoA family FMN-dependent monooxygenase [Actinomyces sp. 565]
MTTNPAKRQMILGMHLGTGYGSQANAWRAPGVNPSAYADIEAQVRYARAAERGTLDFLFLPDNLAITPSMGGGIPQATMDPVVTIAALARATSRIGFVATGTTTFNEPYNIARQYKALDVITHGRFGWNAVTTADPAAAANFGQTIAERPVRYGRAHEVIQTVQALWGSWGEDAWTRDKATGRFVDMDRVRPVNLRGEHVASQGPLPIPPSEQGQPVIFSAGGGEYGLTIAGRYASGVIGAAFTIEDARTQRDAVRRAARQYGRNPEEVKFFAGLMPLIGATVEDALARRRQLDEVSAPQRVPYLGAMLGLALEPEQIDRPLTAGELADARPSGFDPRSQHALSVAREGWTIRDILAHGIIDYHPTPVGPPSVVADHMQEWFEAGACDGFWISPDVNQDGIDTFVDEVVPILRERGLFHDGYRGTTLREHLGVPPQYGLDPRVMRDAQ